MHVLQPSTVATLLGTEIVARYDVLDDLHSISTWPEDGCARRQRSWLGSPQVASAVGLEALNPTPKSDLVLNCPV